MGDLKNIFSKLNIAEQMQLNSYINKAIKKELLSNSVELEKAAEEKEKILKDLNDKTWERIETFLHIAMRELHISPERIKKIDARVLALSNECNDKLLIGEERKTEFKILKDADFQNMVELLMDSSCKNCKQHSKKCEVHQLLKKYNIPYSGCKGKCKYAYYKIGKKVV